MTDMISKHADCADDLDTLMRLVDGAVRAIPPVWPLASSVAVNPYLGQADQDLAQTGSLLARVGGQPITMDRSWYMGKIDAGEISNEDIAAALALAPAELRPADVEAVKAGLQGAHAPASAIPSVVDLATQHMGTDWSGLLAERFGGWAAGYFDEGQALWAAPKSHNAFEAWRDVATHDLTPEVAGLTGFAQHVADTPLNAQAMIARAVTSLGLSPQAMPTYFHSLLMSLGGWSQVARYKLWRAELAGENDTTAMEFLAIRLVWEEALLGLAGNAIAQNWSASVAAHAAPVKADADLVLNSIAQEAAERAGQRTLMALFASEGAAKSDARPALQAAFCIDVRSEVYRRALESVDPSVQTLGFAGFFGITPAHYSFASDVEELRLPVLINPALRSVSGTDLDSDKDQALRFAKRAKRAWGRFKLAAVSSFAFVEATGPLYAGKLVRDAIGGQAKAAPNDPAPRLDPALDLETQIGAANTVLRAMSLTENFAKVIVIAGHGANVTNNAHASALHCGACGGYSGEVNARLLAGLLNSANVRAGLVEKGITLPDDTLFVAALHDTTTDAVTLYDGDGDTSAHGADLATVKGWLNKAGQLTRAERALRLPRADNEQAILPRSSDWAETRPEWALAGCRAFIAAPRERTSGKVLNGRAFLHDYVWQKDDGFGVLELILTAPVVVASWISLQYYGSCVSPQAFGGGNKMLHNVTGGIGVVEGNGGLLRPGLPMQSVHDGENYAHDPLRLTVCVEAPEAAILDILSRHKGVRDLFDNRWLHLVTLDEHGQMASRYCGDLSFEAIAGAKDEALEKLAS